MSDNIIDTFQSPAAARHVCRVAYTLGAYQPVRSTIIDENPYFYQDIDPETEGLDDGMESAGLFFNPDEFDALEREIENLRREIKMLERASEGAAIKQDEAEKYFQENAVTFARTYILKTSNQAERLQVLTDRLRRSRLASAYLDSAECHGVKIEFCGQAEGAHYDRRLKVISINPILADDDVILLAVRELRRHWQHRQGALIHPLLFHPDSAILVNRAQCADLAVSMVRIAWEMQLSVDRAVWERIETTGLGDLGRAFAREAFADFRTINNGKASAAVFETWFLSERPRHEDKTLIREMLADYKGYVFEGTQSRNMLTPAIITALGIMPYGNNYLSAHAAAIVSDPAFNEVRDRSNSNFLWFIKFENTFRETERDLQSHPAPTQPGTRTGIVSKQDISQDTSHEHAKVVRLFAEDRQSVDKSGRRARAGNPGSGRQRTKGNTSADIIYLRRWSSE